MTAPSDRECGPWGERRVRCCLLSSIGLECCDNSFACDADSSAKKQGIKKERKKAPHSRPHLTFPIQLCASHFGSVSSADTSCFESADPSSNRVYVVEGGTCRRTCVLRQPMQACPCSYSPAKCVVTYSPHPIFCSTSCIRPIHGIIHRIGKAPHR